MNLDEAEDREAAAAEYVAGSLTDSDRIAFAARLATDPALRKMVYDWSDRLLGLARRAAPREPSPTLWARIEDRLAPPATTSATIVPDARATAANASRWDRVATWRAATGLALAASIVLSVLLAMRGPGSDETHRFLAVLQSPTEKSTGWVVEGSQRAGVRLVPIGHPAAAPAGKVLQFWTKPDGARGPTSLGLVRADEVAVVPIGRLPALGDQQLFEVTLEPEGGSTIGRPTGPVLYVGKTVSL